MEYENPLPVSGQAGLPGRKTGKHMGLAVASLILGGVSVLCCFAYGFGIVPGLIAVIFGIIAVVSGEGKARVMGAVGLVLGIAGIVMAVIVIMYYVSIINWDNMTLSNLAEFQYIDPDDPQQVQQWLQQFFKQDISGIIHS